MDNLLLMAPKGIVAKDAIQDRAWTIPGGIKELDGLLGGGFDRGTTTLIAGPAGTGKSTLAAQYALRLAENGEHSMMFTFDECRGIMLQRAKALGLDLEKHISSGVVVAQQVDPAELSPGEFAAQVRRSVVDGAKLVVIDSLNGYLNAMPGEKYLTNQLHELTSFLNQQGMITILILAQHGLVSATESPVDLSYLADTVISLRYFEAGGEVKQALSVIKKRSGHHEKTIREFKLVADRGILIGGPLKEFQGVLTGVPNFIGREQQMLK